MWWVGLCLALLSPVDVRELSNALREARALVHDPGEVARNRSRVLLDQASEILWFAS